MTRPSIRNILLPCLILFLAACSTSTPIVQTSAPPVTVAVVASTATPSITPTPNLDALVTAGVATYSARQTQIATLATSTPTPTPYPTLAPEPTLPIATQNAIATMVAFPSICQYPQDWEFSPNGKWIAFICMGGENDQPGRRILPGLHPLTETINGNWFMAKRLGQRKKDLGEIFILFIGQGTATTCI